MKKFLALFLAVVMVLGLCAVASAEETGSVYYLNFKPEADAALQEIAALYTAETGVPVKVVTAASGTYQQTLSAEMTKSEAPTLFVIGNREALGNWDEYALDLTGTAVAGELTTNDFNLYNDEGALKAMGYCYESFGIITNVDLLEKAGHSIDEIKDFASLKAVADDIHANAETLGFDAFSAPGLDGSSSWRFSGHLANLPLYYEFKADGITTQPATIKGSYMDNFRNIWDLYITDTAADAKTLTSGTGDESRAEIVEGKAVFYQNGSWEYATLSDAGLNVQMIPIYCGVEGEEKAGLCSGTENCWAVNAQASEADQKATLDFLYWLVTSEAGTSMMVEQFGSVPFKAAPASTNGFIKNGDALLADGCYSVTWAFVDTPNVDSWRATVVTALAKYSADPTDANWAEVVTAFVDGWAVEYNMVHG
ncbi:MAG: extracellular solute-binding protein [Clostridiales bacterium]|nr:extracellular solute-binding protein [Clostridiales bacterium]MCI6434486.1 extracellular solute-binding protein [Clostridiales bacterium]